MDQRVSECRYIRKEKFAVLKNNDFIPTPSPTEFLFLSILANSYQASSQLRNTCASQIVMWRAVWVNRSLVSSFLPSGHNENTILFLFVFSSTQGISSLLHPTPPPLYSFWETLANKAGPMQNLKAKCVLCLLSYNWHVADIQLT